MASEQVPPRPDARNPVVPDDRSFHIMVWVTVGVNTMLALSALAGWFGRRTSCDGGCSWRPMGGTVWVLLAVVDVGLVLLWAGIGYLHLVGVGKRIGHRISDKRNGDAERD